jgi:hypothetical protein
MGQRSRQKLARRILQSKLTTLSQDDPWTPFERATGKDGNYQMFDGTHIFDIWKNSIYTVMTRVIRSSDPEAPEIIHLSIKRNDKAPILKWRDMQKIKNDLVGSECEAIQIFPAESRLVDTSNQYHLYCFNDPTYRIPFGYQERFVYEGNSHGAVQEPFEDHVRPKDLISQEQMDEAYRKFMTKNDQG